MRRLIPILIAVTALTVPSGAAARHHHRHHRLTWPMWVRVHYVAPATAKLVPNVGSSVSGVLPADDPPGPNVVTSYFCYVPRGGQLKPLVHVEGKEPPREREECLNGPMKGGLFVPSPCVESPEGPPEELIIIDPVTKKVKEIIFLPRWEQPGITEVCGITIRAGHEGVPLPSEWTILDRGIAVASGPFIRTDGFGHEFADLHTQADGSWRLDGTPEGFLLPPADIEAGLITAQAGGETVTLDPRWRSCTMGGQEACSQAMP